MSMFSLKDRVALVTGASRGLGFAMAQALAEAGAHVAINARDAAAVEAAAAKLRERGLSAEAAAFDVADGPASIEAVADLAAKHGRLDILVNNAGATQSGDFFQLDDAVWEDGFMLKFYSYVRLSRALWPMLKESRGVVVNVIGAASKTPSPNFMIGGAVNAAITNFTKALAGIGLRDGVRVNAVHPGMTVTGRLDRLLDQRAATEGISREAYERKELAAAGLRSYAGPGDIANLVAFLASPRSGQIHGADLFIDGGATKTIL